MIDPVRKPSEFGNHEVNAELRYVEVTEILPDPDPEADPPDNFPEPYQPVLVKLLRFTNYAPASSGTVDGGNSDFVVRTTKSHKKHGSLGNDIAVEFVIDSGADGAEAAFDEDTDTLTITVENDEVTWEQVESAVATVLSGAFVLIAETPGAEVGASIESVTATLGSGTNGAYAMYGSEFAVGDHDLKDEVSVGNQFWVTWRKDALRWERLSGSGGGSSSIRYGRVVVPIPRATTAADDGWAEVSDAVSLLDDAGEETEPGDPIDVVNRDGSASYEVDCQVKLDMSHSPPQIITGDCYPQTPEFWGDEE